MTTLEKTRAAWAQIQTDALHAVLQDGIDHEALAEACVCEFSSDDNTPTLHIYLWRGYDLSDLPQSIAGLDVAADGNWDGGKSYSLQIP
jgi:hypothetical protein